jgi:adenylate cyclase
MSTERELKFLVRSDAWRQEVFRSARFEQCVLVKRDGRQVRVRLAEKNGETSGLITFKGPKTGDSREEFELSVDPEQARALLSSWNDGSYGSLIVKERYYASARFGFLRGVWEIDVFQGNNTGLVVAELELDERFPPGWRPETQHTPAWLGADVTDDARFANTNLAQCPFKSWPPSEVDKVLRGIS